MIFEIGPIDDLRQTCQVRFASKTTLDKVLASTIFHYPNIFDNFRALLNSHSALRPCAAEISERVVDHEESGSVRVGDVEDEKRVAKKKLKAKRKRDAKKRATEQKCEANVIGV
jgi:hypothetical protein